MNSDKLRFIAGNGNRELAARVAAGLGLELLPGDLVSCFSGDEVRVMLENVREQHVVIFQSTQPPAENLIELFLIIDAAFNAKAAKITVVIPHYGYARQDRKDKPREPISAKAMAKLIDACGARSVVILDPHSPQIQGFFDNPAEIIWARRTMVHRLKSLVEELGDVILCPPDAGAVPMVRSYANRLNLRKVYADKERSGPGELKQTTIVGDVKGAHVVLIDDMIDTAGTVCSAAAALEEKGAKSIVAVAVHPIFSGNAIERIIESPIKHIIVTNSTPVDGGKLATLQAHGVDVEIVDLADLFVTVIEHIHNGIPVSTLFE